MEIARGELEGGFQRGHGGETALGGLRGGFLCNLSSRVSTFGGH